MQTSRVLNSHRFLHPTVVIQQRNMQEYSQYSSCQGTQAIAVMTTLLSSSNPAPAKALSGLLYTPNQTAVIQELLNVIGNQYDRDLREAAGQPSITKPLVAVHLDRHQESTSHQLCCICICSTSSQNAIRPDISEHSQCAAYSASVLLAKKALLRFLWIGKVSTLSACNCRPLSSALHFTAIGQTFSSLSQQLWCCHR